VQAQARRSTGLAGPGKPEPDAEARASNFLRPEPSKPEPFAGLVGPPRPANH